VRHNQPPANAGLVVVVPPLPPSSRVHARISQPASQPTGVSRYTHAAARLTSRSAKWEADLPRLTVASNYCRLRSSTHDRERVGTRRDDDPRSARVFLEKSKSNTIHRVARHFREMAWKRMFLRRISSWINLLPDSPRSYKGSATIEIVLDRETSRSVGTSQGRRTKNGAAHDERSPGRNRLVPLLAIGRSAQVRS